MIDVHYTINLKIELIRCLEAKEIMKGRTNITNRMRSNWAYHVNMMLHPKSSNNQIKIKYHE